MHSYHHSKKLFCPCSFSSILFDPVTTRSHTYIFSCHFIFSIHSLSTLSHSVLYLSTFSIQILSSLSHCNFPFDFLHYFVAHLAVQFFSFFIHYSLLTSFICFSILSFYFFFISLYASSSAFLICCISS